VTEHCDVVIIGTGAGGGTIANVLTVIGDLQTAALVSTDGTVDW
jgi:choline dehydrogenase-like flavoprotein